MNDLVIEKNIPIPTRVGTFGSALQRMEIGDRVVVSVSASCAHTAARRAGIKIATRKTADGLVRIWRVA